MHLFPEKDEGEGGGSLSEYLISITLVSEKNAGFPAAVGSGESERPLGPDQGKGIEDAAVATLRQQGADR